MSIKLNNINNFAHLSTNEHEREQPSCETLPVSSFEFQEAVTYEGTPKRTCIFYICSIVISPSSSYQWDIVLSQTQYDKIYRCITSGNSTIEVPAYTELEKSILLPNLGQLKRKAILTKYYQNAYYSKNETFQGYHSLIMPNEHKQNDYAKTIKNINDIIS